MNKIKVKFAQNCEKINFILIRISCKKCIDWNEASKTEHLIQKNHQMCGQTIDITIQKWGYETSRELKNRKNSRSKVKSKNQESDNSYEDHYEI